MKTTLQKMIITGMVLFMCAMLQAQSFTATYTYDANGNRILAQVTYLLKSVKLDQSQDSLKTTSLDSLGNCIVRIYPNPTHGDLIVEIDGVTPDQFSAQGNAIKIWNMQGKMVLDIPVRDSNNPVDLSNIAVGPYVLKLYINGKVKSYKIIKE
jgi:hypothetical protein